jgi:hypothetical protein
MIPQHGPASEEQPLSVAQMIAAICDALRAVGNPREEAQPPAGPVADQLDVDARLQRIRTRLDWIDAQVRDLEAELAVLKRIAGQSASAAAEDERSRHAGMTG